MNITLNNDRLILPDYVLTVADLIKWKNIPSSGTAIAVNNKLVLSRNREVTKLEEGDDVTVISATFGG